MYFLAKNNQINTFNSKSWKPSLPGTYSARNNAVNNITRKYNQYYKWLHNGTLMLFILLNEINNGIQYTYQAYSKHKYIYTYHHHHL